MTTLSFELPDGSTVEVDVRRLLNAGYAGRDQTEVQAHIDELAELGVPGPEVTPALYPVAPYLAAQTDAVPAQHGRTSGEAEWALVITGNGPDDVLLTVACDHTDRALEVHGVAWSKNANLDVLGRQAWRLTDVAGHLDQIALLGRVGAEQTVIQRATLAALLTPAYWLEVLRGRGEASAGTVLLSGTIAMIEGVDQFSDRWEAELIDPVLNRSIRCAYSVEQLPDPIG